MIRHARMRGHPTLFLPGLDHASIAAQFVLDGILAKEGESRQSLGRERYLERMREFVDDDPRGDARPAAAGRRLARLGPAALHDGRRLGQGRPRRLRAAVPRRTSPTAPRRSSTGARAAGRASATSRSSRRPRPGTLWSVRYHLIDAATGEPDPDATITVATTRPETILGDTAVAVHPDDPRYRRARRPAGPHPVRRARRADHRRRRSSTAAFGTGAVKITPAHDHDDYADRPAPRPADADDPRRRGARSPSTGTPLRRARPLRGARSAIVADLEARGDLVGRDAARDGHRPLPAQRRRHRAAAQDAVVHPDRAARGARARGDADRAGRGSCPSGSRRPGSTG